MRTNSELFVCSKVQTMAAAWHLTQSPLSLLPLPIHHYKLHNYQLFSSPSTLTPLLPSKPHHHHRYRVSSTSTSFPFPFYQSQPRAPDEQSLPDDFLDEDHAIGDCLVFEEGVFEGNEEESFPSSIPPEPKRNTTQRGSVPNVENLVPEKWKEAVLEINLNKKERRAIARELKFGSKVERKWRTLQPGNDLGEYLTYKQMKLSELKPIVLDDPVELPPPPADEDTESGVRTTTERAAPRNPRSEVAGEGLDSITEFFNSGDYVPGEVYDDKKPKSSRKLFTKEEKMLLNRRIPSLSEATSSKWIPLQTLAASGEFYLMDLLLKHDVDINAVDTDGLSAVHKAILGKKQAILNYLLRESANPFIQDNDGATLMHYAVQAASSPAIKVLLLYNVDVNLCDRDGWTPLHLAVQTQRTDIVKLLLIKGADRTLKNQDGLTPLDICLYSGRSPRTLELIKLLKELPTRKKLS